jgi:hypothetical protein
VSTLSLALLGALGFVAFRWLVAREDASKLRTQVDQLKRRLARRDA